MRRTEKEITDRNEILSILEEADICRIALCDKGIPYLVPMNFGVCGNSLYLHSSREGRKIDIIKENNNVCFEVETKTELVRSSSACEYAMKYLSVVGNGKAYIIDTKEEKIKGLNYIMKKYKGDGDYKYNDKTLARLLVIRIEIEQMTGKRSGYEKIL